MRVSEKLAHNRGRDQEERSAGGFGDGGGLGATVHGLLPREEVGAVNIAVTVGVAGGVVRLAGRAEAKSPRIEIVAVNGAVPIEICRVAGGGFNRHDAG